MISASAQRERMLTAPVGRLVTGLAIPTVVIQLITLIYNTADTYFISQIDKSASAAVGSVFSIMALIQAIGFGSGMGSSSICSRLLGAGKNEEADVYCSSAFFAAIFLGMTLSVIGLFGLDVLLSVIGCSETMIPYARPYAIFILIGAPVFCATFVLNNTLRAEGQTKLAMFGMAGGGLLNMILDPLFIFVFDMGTAGAAIATLLSQVVSFCILSFQFLRKRTILHIVPQRVSRQIRTYSLIFTTGFPTICRQGLASLATVLINRQAVLYGDALVAAVSIANKCYMLVRNVVLGLGQGFQTVAGYNYGAGDHARTRKAFRFSCMVGSVFCVFSAILIAFFAGNIMYWFCTDQEVVVYGTRILYFACCVMPFMAFSTYVNQLYQCLGFRLPATVLASCRQGICLVPLTFVLPIFLGLTGVQMIQPMADMLTALVSVPFFIHMFSKKLN